MRKPFDGLSRTFVGKSSFSAKMFQLKTCKFAINYISEIFLICNHKLFSINHLLRPTAPPNCLSIRQHFYIDVDCNRKRNS